MKKTTIRAALATLILSAAILLSSCSGKKCNVTLLSFNNHLSYKIEVVVPNLLLTAVIEPGSSKTVHVEPDKKYDYTVKEYFSGNILRQDNIAVEACASQGVNIK